MKTLLRSFVCIAAIGALAVTAEAARPKTKKQPYTPPPTPTPTPAPSVDLSHFVSTNLDKILAPLDQKSPMPRADLAQLRASISSRFSKATLAERPQFQTALTVCDGIAQCMDERDKAMLNPATANWPQRSVQLRQGVDLLLANQRAAESGAAAPAH